MISRGRVFWFVLDGLEAFFFFETLGGLAAMLDQDSRRRLFFDFFGWNSDGVVSWTPFFTFLFLHTPSATLANPFSPAVSVSFSLLSFCK